MAKRETSTFTLHHDRCDPSKWTVSDPVADFIAMRDVAVQAGVDACAVCGQVNAWPHDHKDDQSGLDDGPWLPGHQPRKRMEPKPAAEFSAIRRQAWATRRAKYGERGHR